MRVLIYLILLSCVTFAPQALAQETGRLQSDRFVPGMDRESILDTQSGGLAPHLSYDVALFAGFALNPLGVSSGDALIKEQVTASLTAQLSLFEWAALGVHLPLSVYQSGDSPVSGIGINTPTSFGVRDPRLLAKIRVLRDQGEGIDIAFIPQVTIPLSDAEYLGESDVTVHPELAFSKNFKDVAIASNIGFLYRPEKTVLGESVGSEATLKIAGRYSLERYGVPFGVNLSLRGGTQVLPDLLQGSTTGAEALFGFDLTLYERLQILVGGGSGLFSAQGVPDFRAYGSFRYAPRNPDPDGDGVAEGDECPRQPEDRDGFRDLDGCPDEDNDGDGILDLVDQCKDDAEDFDNDRDEDGCPDLDEDDDGVPDENDKCPNEREDRDGFEDDDGCLDADNDNDGVADATDKCPEQKEDVDGFEDLDGCADVDNDGDGIKDSDDKCPNAAEDKDGLMDEDGCPEVDADSDGVADENDKCPNDKETINGVQDDDGCADVGAAHVEVTDTAIILKTPLAFYPNSKKLRNPALVQELAAHLRAQAALRVAINVHTGGSGNAARHLQLSQDRADELMAALVNAGVSAARLQAIGRGDTTPIAGVTSASGRARNRRVEISILPTP